MPKRKTGSDSPKAVATLVSAMAQFNSNGTSVAVETIRTADGKEHTFRVILKAEEQLQLRQFVAGLFRASDNLLGLNPEDLLGG